MQQCAQCSKSVAVVAASSASATRLINALELPWPLVNDNNASLSSVNTPSTSKRQTLYHSSPSLLSAYKSEDAGRASSSSSSSCITAEKHARQAGHQQRPQRSYRRTPHRAFSTSVKDSRDVTTQAKFIDMSKTSSSPGDAATTAPTKSTSAGDARDGSNKSAGDISYTANTTSSSRHDNDADEAQPQGSSFTLQRTSKVSSAKHLQYLNEEVVPSSLPENNSSDKAQSNDQINTLLAYPTLYDPIRKPRFPIVLCHGLYGFDTWGLELLPALKVHYWADVLQTLKGVVGVDPIVVGVPGTGAITDRAKQLHKVLRNDKKLAGKQVNLIGHSMGGLDCRHLLSNIRPTEYHPASLTTLATPHRGSPFMAWCRANIGIGDIARAAEEASKEFSSSSSSSSSSSEVNLPYSLKTPIFSRSKWQQSQKDKDGGISESDREAIEQTKAAARQAVKDASSAISGESSKSSTKAAITKTVINLPGLNFTLGTSLASYLLDLLDSPAYSNLTSDYLEKIFNPNTPDRDDIKYFSIAARINKLPITHPLWLPKLIVDKAQEWEKAKDVEKNRERPTGWQWGNDGLVPVESARWGEFLGVLDGADHWSIRGGAGFTTEPKGKKKDTATQATTPAAEKKAVVDNVSHKQEKQTEKGGTTDSTRHPDTANQEEASELDKLGEKAKAAVSTIVDMAAPVAEATSNVLPSWSDINTAVFKGLDDSSDNSNGKNNAVSSGSAAPSKVLAQENSKKGTEAAKSSPSTANSNLDTLKTLSGIAGWVAKRIPLPSSNKGQLKSSIDPAYPLDDTAVVPKSMTSNSTPASASDKTSVTNAARLLFGSSSSSSSKTSKTSNGESNKFNRERFYVALCKKLYDEGF